MPSLQVRDVPETLFIKLKQAAERDHRSLAQEAVFMLEKGLEIEQKPKQRRRDLLQQISAFQTGIDAGKLASPVDLIREYRDR